MPSFLSFYMFSCVRSTVLYSSPPVALLRFWTFFHFPNRPPVPPDVIAFFNFFLDSSPYSPRGQGPFRIARFIFPFLILPFFLPPRACKTPLTSSSTPPRIPSTPRPPASIPFGAGPSLSFFSGVPESSISTNISLFVFHLFLLRFCAETFVEEWTSIQCSLLTLVFFFRTFIYLLTAISP